MLTLPRSGGGVGGIANLPYAYLSLKQRTKWATLAKKIQLVGLAEAAEIVGVAPSTLAMRRASARSEALPKPLADHVRPGQPSAFSRRRQPANGSRPDSGPTRLDGYPPFRQFLRNARMPGVSSAARGRHPTPATGEGPVTAGRASLIVCALSRCWSRRARGTTASHALSCERLDLLGLLLLVPLETRARVLDELLARPDRPTGEHRNRLGEAIPARAVQVAAAEGARAQSEEWEASLRPRSSSSTAIAYTKA